MGEKNDVFCAWLEKAEIFSDFMNGAMFAGKQKILPGELATGRVEDIRKAMNNSEFRRKLYREYGIDGGSRE